MVGTSTQESEASTETTGSNGQESSQCQLRIRYRTELRHHITGDLIHRKDSDKPPQREIEDLDSLPILELITRYETGGSKLDEAGDTLQESSTGQSLESSPSYFLRIYSSSIIHALRSVVQYYPSQDLSGSSIDIKWPYAVLVHHYDALRDFKTDCDAKKRDELCDREKDASAHVAQLLRFLDENIMERVKAEKKRLQERFHTFENLWIIFRPGSTVLFRNLHSEWKAMVISHVTGGIYENVTTSWSVVGWHLEFDGKYLGRRNHEMILPPFNGESSWEGNTIFVHDAEMVENEEIEKLIRFGEMYCGLLTRQCRQHRGKSVIQPYNEVR